MRTVADPAGRSGMASGVEPASRSLTNTRAPAGRDCTLSPPAVARHHPRVGGHARPRVRVPAGRTQVNRRRRRRPPRRQLQRALFRRVAVARYTNRIRSERQVAQRQRSFSARLSIHQHIGIGGRRSNQQAARRRARNRARCRDATALARRAAPMQRSEVHRVRWVRLRVRWCARCAAVRAARQAQ